MSLHGIVKGRPFEAFVEKMMQGEATGVMMYYALARLAKEQGLDEVSKEFMAIGNEEAFHSGFYAVLKGAYPQDFWNLVRSLQKVEAAGEEKIKAISDEFRAAGLSEAADEMAVFARQEGGHGFRLERLSIGLHRKKHPWKEGKSTAAPCAVMSMSGTLKANRMTMSARSAVSLKKPLSLKNRQSQSRESYKKKRALRFFASGRRTALTEPE